MKFENDYDVDAPIDEVWAAVLDVERVAPCVPGAQVLERTGENAYKVAIKVKVGPMSMQYRGDVQIVESDPEAHRAVMRTRAREARGQGTADANVEMRLEGDQSRTHGTIETDVRLSGRVAAMGGGVIKDVSARIVDQFSENLAAMLAGPEAPAQAAAAPSGDGNGAPSGASSPDAGSEREAGTGEPSRPSPSAGAGGPSAGRPTPAPDEDASLPALSILGSVIAGRLRDPRALGATLGLVAVVAFLLGRRSR